MDADYSHLENFPTFVFSQLIDKWYNTNIELAPNGLFSEENLFCTVYWTITGRSAPGGFYVYFCYFPEWGMRTLMK